MSVPPPAKARPITTVVAQNQGKRKPSPPVEPDDGAAGVVGRVGRGVGRMVGVPDGRGVGEGDAVPFWAMARFSGNKLYDLENDPNEENNLAGGALENALALKLREALISVDAPQEQFARLKLS